MRAYKATTLRAFYWLSTEAEILPICYRRSKDSRASELSLPYVRTLNESLEPIRVALGGQDGSAQNM